MNNSQWTVADTDDWQFQRLFIVSLSLQLVVRLDMQ